MDQPKQLCIAVTILVLALAILGGIVAFFGVNAPTAEITSMPTHTEQTAPAPPQMESQPVPTTEPATEPSIPITDPVTEPTDPVAEPTDPVTEPTEPVTEPTEPVTEPTEPVTEPTEETQPPTDPTENQPEGNELIGNLYTRDQLEAIDGTRLTYGPGRSVNGSRPVYACDLQKTYGTRFNTYFIGPDNGKVYLTFAHGYERNNLTAIVLDALKEKNVKAVFFINRDYARLAPDMVWRMINEGHIVANHATKHPDMGKQTVDQMVSEIMTMHNYMLENFGYKMTLFRPPSGYYSPRLLAVAQSLGYTTVQWSYAYRDWDESAPPDHDTFLNDIVNSAHSGAIYYFHTVTPSGVAAICDSIDALRAKGYEFDLFTGNFA